MVAGLTISIGRGGCFLIVGILHSVQYDGACSQKTSLHLNLLEQVATRATPGKLVARARVGLGRKDSRLLGKGNGEGEGTALALAALHLYAAAVGLHQLLDYGQAQAGPAVPA